MNQFRRQMMRILQVAHSFVPYTMAGTEVYSYKLSKELAKNNRVFIFFRINDPKEKEYALRYAPFEGLDTYAINRTFRFCRSFRETYADEEVDRKFGQLLEEIRPQIVHIHHLLFLSSGMIKEVKKRNIPVVYTLHDYWLICYRGQLIREDLTCCNERGIAGCRECLRYLLCINQYSMYFYQRIRKMVPPGFLKLLKKFYSYCFGWAPSTEIETWQSSIQELYPQIDLFIAPSNFMRNKFVARGVSPGKIVHSSYGMDKSNFSPPLKHNNDHRPLRFGYIGTLLPMKGVGILISAFKAIKNSDIELLIYGKVYSYSGFEYYPNFLKKMSANDIRIKFKGGYDNKDIAQVLASFDLLIVPSLWQENSPLVIQEAFLSRTPVIASRIGGIPELIADNISGLLFNPGDINDLQNKMESAIDDPGIMEKFRRNIPKVKSIEENAREIEEAYSRLLNLSA